MSFQFPEKSNPLFSSVAQPRSQMTSQSFASKQVSMIAQSTLLSMSAFDSSKTGLMRAKLVVDSSRFPETLSSTHTLRCEHFEKPSAQILESFQRFSDRLDALLNPLEDLTLELKSSIRSDPKMYEVRKKRLSQIMPILTQQIFLLQKTQEHLLELQGGLFDVEFEYSENTLNMLAYARMKEMDILQKQILVLQDQDNHELALAAEIYSYRLAEETMKFDQLLSLYRAQKKGEEQSKSIKKKLLIQDEKAAEKISQLVGTQKKMVEDHLAQMGAFTLQKGADCHKIDVLTRKQLLDALLANR